MSVFFPWRRGSPPPVPAHLPAKPAKCETPTAAQSSAQSPAGASIPQSVFQQEQQNQPCPYVAHRAFPRKHTGKISTAAGFGAGLVLPPPLGLARVGTVRRGGPSAFQRERQLIRHSKQEHTVILLADFARRISTSTTSKIPTPRATAQKRCNRKPNCLGNSNTSFEGVSNRQRNQNYFKTIRESSIPPSPAFRLP